MGQREVEGEGREREKEDKQERDKSERRRENERARRRKDEGEKKGSIVRLERDNTLFIDWAFVRPIVLPGGQTLPLSYKWPRIN